MPRAVLVVNSMELDDGKNINTCMIEESFDENGAHAQFRLNCTPSDPEFVKLQANPPQVRGAGEKLYKALTASQAGANLFAQWSVVPRPAPIYFHVDSPEVEELPWETLYDTEFRALNGDYPIARLASSPRPRAPIDRLIGSELRVAVVLAAAGVNGADEWANVSSAVVSFGTGVDVLALVSEKATYDKISADAAAWQGQEPAHKLKVEYVGDTDSLVKRICAHLPNIVHFFCHGVVDVRPLLELESRADRIQKKERGSISLGLDFLKPLTTLETLWLVVLNCCQGAKRAPQLHSLARDLVARGVPAVVAMRESIEVNDANLFARHFYEDLLGRLTGVFAIRRRAGAPQTLPMPQLVCVQAVDAARRKLTNQPREPATSVQWTFPVVYVHRDDLLLHVRDIKLAALSESERRALIAELNVLKQMHDALRFPNEEEAAQRDQFAARIAEIHAKLAGA